MKFTESHEWIRFDGKLGTVGVTHYAQKELGDIVYIELPKVGQRVEAGQEVCVLESTKAATDVYAPVSGKITAVNEALLKETSLINRGAESSGWLFRIETADPKESSDLLTKVQYDELIS